MSEPSNPLKNELEQELQARETLIQDYTKRENELMAQASAERAGQSAHWENLITQTKVQCQDQQLKSYSSSAKAMAKLLGMGVRDQAKLMIPFEVAEATKEFARFLSTRDPLALASSLQHALAVKQYAEAAGGGGGGGHQAGGGGGAGTKPTPETAEAKPASTSRIVIEGARRDPNQTVTLTGDQLYQIVDGINSKWREGSIVLDFAR